MGSGSRIALLVAALVAAFGALAAVHAARGAPAASGIRVACPQKTFLVGFYPKGEPAQRKAHVKVFTKRQFVALVLPKRLSFGPICRAAHDGKTTWDGSRAKTTRKRIVLRCTVGRRIQLRGVPFVGADGTYAGNHLFALLGGTTKVFLRASVAVRGSTLSYDPHYCKKR